MRFYERREVRDALAYLRMLVNPDDQVSLRRILNVPKRGIGDRAVECVNALAERERITFWEALRRADQAPGLATRSLTSIKGFVAMVEELQSMVAADERADVILESVLARSGYLEELEASDDPQDETRVENLGELVAVAREFSDDPTAGPSADPSDVEAGLVAPGLGDFLERVALVADTDQIPDEPDPDRPEDTGVVTLMTLHTAKGLEFPVVFLTGLEDGIFPALALLGRRPGRARGRAPARVRRRHPRPRAALRLAGGDPLGLGCSEPQPRLAVPRRAADRPGRLAPHRGSTDAVGPPRPGQRLGRPPRRPDLGWPTQLLRRGRPGRRCCQGEAGSRDPVAGAGRPGAARLVRHGHRRGHGGRRPTRRWPRSTSAPKASSGCCSAMRRSRSSDRPGWC